MKLIIDGYNVLKYYHGASLIKQEQRDAFARAISGYCKRKGHVALIVFDGIASDVPMQEAMGAVTIVYVGGNKSADDYIVEYVMMHKHMQMLLVSSDRELNRRARAVQADSIDVKDFIECVRDYSHELNIKRGPLKDPIVVKTTEVNTSSFLDALMMEESDRMPYSKHEQVKPHSKKSVTLSKYERKLLQKYKKL